MTKQKMVVISVAAEMDKKFRAFKKSDRYFDKPYSKLYRDLIRIGIEVMEQQISTES